MSTAHPSRATMALPLLALTAVLAAQCKQEARPDGAAQRSAESERAAARAVQLVTIGRQPLAKTVLVTGTLAADERVTASAKVAGRLASIAVDIGSVVKRDQPIAQVERTDYQLRVEQAASALGQARALLGLAPNGTDDEVDVEQTSLVQEARATLEEARANFERARALVEQRMIPPAEFETAKAAFTRAETGLARARDEIRNREATLRQRVYELRAARQQLADTTVRAPLDGVVQQRHALAGEYLAAGAAVATIVRTNPLRLRVEVAERDAPLVHVGQAVHVRVDGDEADHLGRIARVAPALTEQNRTLVVEAEIANDEGSLRPGSFARGEIVLDDASPVLVVPVSAIVTFAGIDKVITVENGKAVEKEISIGRRTDRWAEVSSGLAAGDQVVLEPGNLQQGQPVTIASK